MMMTMSQLSTEHHLRVHEELHKLHQLVFLRRKRADLYEKAAEFLLNELIAESQPGWEKLCPHCGQELPEPEDSSS